MREVAFIISALTGCSFEADIAGAGFRCELTADCPDGFVCSDGFCRDGAPLGGDAGAGESDAVSCSFGNQGCPEGYAERAGSCYRLVPEPTRWEVAETECEADCAHLVVIGEAEIDVDEHYEVHDLSQGAPEVWVGVTDRVNEDGFRWVTGPQLDLAGNDCFWEGGEPDDQGNQDCVIQRAVDECGDWATEPCTAEHPFICEYDGRVVEPAAF